MQYDVMDVREMTYPSESFDLVIDKSTIDTLMCSENPLINVSKMIGEGYRVLRPGCYYFTVSYSGNRVEHFTRENVKFDVKKIELKRLNN
jgi:ubiquinone/menaquinone biosynthesis C-methylase UbiE